MATQAPRKSTPAVKHEALIEQQLSKARLRVRLLDVGAAIVGFLLLLFTFGLSMALADRWAGGLPVLTRQLVLAGFVLMALCYLGAFLVWPLLRPVNPYYAALKVEETLPAAKNSVVNWLDLHGQPLPPAFRTAVASRAAKDLAKADIDRAFSPRRLIVLGLVTAVVFIAFALNLALGGREFLGRLANVFMPFGHIKGPGTATQLALVEPRGGDATISVGRSVSFAVNVTGYVPKTNRPDSVRLMYRYHPNDPYETKPLERESAGGSQWVTQMPAFQVHSGFWYRIAGGDATTDEYRIQTRATPLISDIVATYHFRPYLSWPEFTVREPNLEAPRGTEVQLLVRTNRQVREGRVEYLTEKGTANIKGEPAGDDPTALRFRFTIDASGSYRIWFTSVEDESNTDPITYKIKSFVDAPPRVEVLKPQDTKLPLNGVLRIEGRADDDFGITGMTLRIQLSADNPVLTKPFREGKKERFKLADGSYPQNLEYHDFVEIDKLRDSQGQALKPGVIEYWLEATDACDFPPPGPNVGKSNVHRVLLSKPDPKDKTQEQKQEKAKQEAKKDQKDFEKKQDDQIKEQSKEAQKKQKDREEAAKDAKQEAEKPDGGKNEKGNEKDKEKSAEKERQDKIEQDIKKELERKEDQGKAKGENKPQDPGEAKGEGKGRGDDPKKNEGEAKPQPQNSEKPGESKGEGKQGEEKGEGKGAGQKEPDNAGDNKQPAEGKGEGKNATPKNEGEGKGEGKNATPEKEGSAKGEGKQAPDQKKQEGEAKGGGKPDPNAGGKDDKGSAKGGPNDDKKGDGKGEAKGGPGQPAPSAEAKGGGSNEGKPGAEKAEARSGGKEGGPKGTGPNAAGQEKPAPAGKPDEIASGKGEGKHAGGKDDQGAAASKQVKDLIDQLEKGTPKQRDEAKEQLEQLKRNAQNPADREAAASALKSIEDKGQTAGSKTDTGAGKGDGAGSKENQEKIDAASRQIKELVDKLRGDDKKEAKRAEEELEKLSRDARAKADRDGAAAAIKEFGEKPPEQPGTDPGKGKGPEGSGAGNNPPEKGGAGEKGKDKGTGGGTKTGNGTGGDPGVGGAPSGPRTSTSGGTPAGPGSQADPEYQRRAGELQLQKFKDQVTPKMLKDLGITEAEWKKFLASRSEKLKAMKPETLPTGRRPGSFLPNGAPRAFETTGKSSDPLQAGRRSLPPPELTEGFKKFGDTAKDKR